MQTDDWRARAIAAVDRSPAAVGVHDKEAWLAVFADLSCVEDPVGSRPHVDGVYDARSGLRGDAALGRFYETFIAPNTITFHIGRDIVCGPDVVRDLDVEITMAPEVVVRVPMHLIYEVGEERGAVKIRHLRAYWELVPMVRQLMAVGPKAWPVSMGLGRRLLGNLGVGGTAGFLRGARTVGAAGKDAVQRLADASGGSDPTRGAELFRGHGAGVRIVAEDEDEVLEPAEFLSGHHVSVDKLLACGPAVSATVEVDHRGGRFGGVGIFGFDWAGEGIRSVDLYWDSDGSLEE